MALALQRDFGQRVVLYTSDGEITVHFNAPLREWAGIGLIVAIEAPSAVRILRGELVDRGVTPQ